MSFPGRKPAIPTAEQALPGGTETMPVPARHFVNGNPLEPPFRAGLETAVFGLGCFWGAERAFWQTAGVYTTAAGYAGGFPGGYCGLGGTDVSCPLGPAVAG